MNNGASIASPLLRKLLRRDDLAPEEVSAITSMFEETRIVAAGDDIVRDGDRPSQSTLVVSGFACRYKVLEGGGRQITALHLPGDFVDLHSFLLKEMDHGVGAISTCRVATVPHETLTRISQEQPHLTRLFWLLTLLDGALHREWLVAMGRQPAVGNLAHLLCELRLRIGAIEDIIDNSFTVPLTQADLGWDCRACT